MGDFPAPKVAVWHRLNAQLINQRTLDIEWPQGRPWFSKNGLPPNQGFSFSSFFPIFNIMTNM